jgi:hypothetical protein
MAKYATDFGDLAARLRSASASRALTLQQKEAVVRSAQVMEELRELQSRFTALTEDPENEGCAEALALFLIDLLGLPKK